MAPPTNRPRLADLVPREVAAQVTGLVAEHVARLLFHLDPTAHFADPGPGSSLGFSAQLLCEWAQTGTNGEGWTPGMAMDGIQAVCEALYSQAGYPGTFGTGDLRVAEIDPETPGGLMIAAAYARFRVVEGEPLSAAELAVLGGMSSRQVRVLA